MNTLLVLALMLLPFACRSAPAAPGPVVQQARTQSASASGDGYVQLSVNGGHGDLLLVMHGERFTGILDGEVLPAERLVRDGDKLTVKGPDGGTLYEVRVLPEAHGMAWPYEGSKVTALAGGMGGNDNSWVLNTGNGQTLFRSPSPNRRIIGVTTSSVNDALRAQLGLQGDAFVIESVSPDMPAARAGVKPFDIVTTIDGQPASSDRLREVLDGKQAGETFTLTVLRKGQSQDLAVTVEDPKPGSTYTVAGIGGPNSNLWTMSSSDSESLKALTEQQQVLEASRQELADELAKIQADTEKLGASQSGEAAAKLAELARRQAELAEQMRKEEQARLGNGNYLGLLQKSDGGSRWLMLPNGSAGAGASAGGAAESVSADRLEALEKRLAKLEALLERMAPQAAASNDSKSGEAPGSKP
jgi:hypothetical protein